MSDTPINVPLLDLKAQYASLRDEIEPVIRDVVEAQWFIMGPKVAELEQQTEEYCNTKHAIGCASGSDSLLLALMALGIGPGDDVICPTSTFFATAGSIHRLGATPIFADIDPPAALTTRGKTVVKGGALINGVNTVPSSSMYRNTS